MAAVQAPQSFREFPLIFVKQSVALATAGFGVVVALAWNELIQSVIAEYIAPFLGGSSGVVSQLIYAIVVTTLAIVVTMQLLRLQSQLELMLKRSNKKTAPAKKALAQRASTPVPKRRGRPPKSAK